jgi:hypothetical protein
VWRDGRGATPLGSNARSGSKPDTSTTTNPATTTGALGDNTVQIHREAVERKPRAYALHHGRSRKPIMRIVPDDFGLYRIVWPDLDVSAPANLSRCKEAALEWAEQRFLTDHRKMNGARRLNSLNNFSWSASPIAPSAMEGLR